jgi:hypothetical protein
MTDGFTYPTRLCLHAGLSSLSANANSSHGLKWTSERRDSPGLSLVHVACRDAGVPTRVVAWIARPPPVRTSYSCSLKVRPSGSAAVSVQSAGPMLEVGAIQVTMSPVIEAA